MSTASGLLLQPSSKRSGREISKDGEINLAIGNRRVEAPPLLPSSYHRSSDRIPAEASVA